MQTIRALRIVFVLLAVLNVSNAAKAKTVHVRGYTRKDGTYVQPHTRSSPKSSYRTSPPSPRTTEARTYEPRTLDPEFQPTSPTIKSTTPLVPPIEPETHPKDEAKAQKLLEFAKREYATGKVESGVKWVRWIVKQYPPTMAATEAHTLLEDWKSNEP